MDQGDPPRDRPDGAGAERAGRPAADLQALARDWITLWQSELAAAAADREVQEAWAGMAALWAGAAAAFLHALPRGGVDRAAGWPGAAAPPRTAAAAAAPDARDAEIERLTRRIDELERRLAELEDEGRGRGGPGRGGGG